MDIFIRLSKAKLVEFIIIFSQIFTKFIFYNAHEFKFFSSKIN